MGKDAAALPDMGDDEDGPRKIDGQNLRYRAECVETTGGGADDDYVAAPSAC